MFHWYMIVLIIGKTLKKIKKSFKKKYKSFLFSLFRDYYH